MTMRLIGLSVGLAIVFFSIDTTVAAENDGAPPELTASGDAREALAFYSRSQLEDLLVQYDGEIQSLAGRVGALEKRADGASWVDRFILKGDFRYRHEDIDSEDDPVRTRNRIRARIFIGAMVNDFVDLGFQVATGVGDPISSNATLDDGFEQKELWIDKAYFDFHPFDNGVQLNFVGGKMQNPFAVMSKSELLWDPDLRPEGIAANLAAEAGCGCTFFSHLGGFSIDEVGGGDDVTMFGGQFGFDIPIADLSTVTAGAGFYSFNNVEGSGALFHGLGGNTADGGGNFAEEFDELEFFAQCAFDLYELPVSLFGNYVENLSAEHLDQGWLAGVKLGKAKEPLSWDLRYQYKVLEADAVFGNFTDSDFGGGGTGVRGHELNAGFMLATNWKLAVTYFINEAGFSSPVMAETTDYNRLQIDLKFKF